MSEVTRYTVWWLPMPLLGVVNGFVRESVLKRIMDAPIADKVSVFTLIILLFIYGLIIRNRLSIISRTNALKCGITWLLLTVGFEFGFGHFVAGVSYEKLLTDYNVLEGRLWPLVLLFNAMLPFYLRRLNSAP